MIDGKTFVFIAFGTLFLFMSYMLGCILFVPFGINDMPVDVFYILGFIGSVLIGFGWIRGIFGSERDE